MSTDTEQIPTPRMDKAAGEPRTWEDTADDCYEEGCRLERELAQVTKERDAFRKANVANADLVLELRSELTALRARVLQAEKMVKALEPFVDYAKKHGAYALQGRNGAFIHFTAWLHANTALESWTTALDLEVDKT